MKTNALLIGLFIAALVGEIFGLFISNDILKTLILAVCGPVIVFCGRRFFLFLKKIFKRFPGHDGDDGIE
jgi:uncharacterized membrane protein YuzA (DUF378 family)